MNGVNGDAVFGVLLGAFAVGLYLFLVLTNEGGDYSD